MFRTISRWKTLLVLVGCLALAACKSDALPDDDEYVRGETVYVPDFNSLWDVAKTSLQSEGYAVDDDLTLAAEARVVSRWAESLAPMRFEGMRRRACILFEQIDPDHWTARVAVQRQRNSAIDDPLDPFKADWEDHGIDEGKSELLLYKIEWSLRRFGP